jgi:hypothetical protein
VSSLYVFMLFGMSDYVIGSGLMSMLFVRFRCLWFAAETWGVAHPAQGVRTYPRMAAAFCLPGPSN